MGTKKSSTHFRRCHVCGTVNDHNEEVSRCMGCGKSLAPFFYFHPRDLKEISDRRNLRLYRKAARSPYRPIIGVFAVWDNDPNLSKS